MEPARCLMGRLRVRLGASRLPFFSPAGSGVGMCAVSKARRRARPWARARGDCGCLPVRLHASPRGSNPERGRTGLKACGRAWRRLPRCNS